MNWLRIFFPLLLIIVPMSVGVSASGYAQNSGIRGDSLGLRASLSAEPRESAFLDLLKRYEFGVPFEGLVASMTRVNVVETPTDGGIREDVPAEYKARFEKWKAEFLSTEYGRQQWDTYATNRKLPVASARSFFGNHSATVLIEAGKLPASPSPRTNLTIIKPRTEANAVDVDT